MKAVSTKTTRQFVPSCDRDLPLADQTIFEIRQLTASEEAVLDNMIGSLRDGSMDMRIGDQELAALHFGLVGVQNFVDENGAPVVILRDAKQRKYNLVNPIKEEILSMIPKDVRKELAEAIVGDAQVKAEEAKN
jgi:hypothetical protein